MDEMQEPIKRGRGRPRKDEAGFDFDNTTIENKSPKKPSGVQIQKETIAEKLHLLCQGAAVGMGYEYEFSPDDYRKEALGVLSLAKDYPVIAKILTWLDPLFIVFALWDKFRHMKRTPKQEKKKQQQQQTVNQPVVNPGLQPLPEMMNQQQQQNKPGVLSLIS